jgi:DNA repair protein RadC
LGNVAQAVSLKIRDLPERERPRERLFSLGADALSDRELIALVLGAGRRGESALDVAAALLAEFGSLEALASALPEELSRRVGVGPAKAAALVAAFRLGRAARNPPSLMVLRSATDVASVALRELDGARRERVIVLVCDSANRLRRVVRVSDGTIDRSLLPVREVLNAVLRHDGRAFAVAHNHPSGDLVPSDADLRALAELSVAARAVGVRLLDHVIVGSGKWKSLCAARDERGTP